MSTKKINKEIINNKINGIKNEILASRQKQLFISYVLFALILIIMLIIFLSYFKNFGEITLRNNNKDMGNAQYLFEKYDNFTNR